MGLLRLFLAGMVMLTHLGYSFFGVSPGVSAVIVFYLLAGHVVSQLWAKRCAQESGAAALWFYQDRLWRIVPLYLAALALAIIAWWAGAHSPFIGRDPHWQDWLANLLIVPLNYYMFTGQDAFTLLPPTWSLGVELQFYVLVPLLMGRPWLQALVTVLSLAVFSLAQFGVLNTDVFGYRLLAGVGFVFLAGTLLGKHDPRSRALLGLLWLVSVIYALWLLISDRHVPYNTEVAVGLALGLPLLQIFLRFPRKGLWQSAQRKAGELSYGVFVMHFPVIWLLELWGFSGPQTACGVFVLSALLAWLAHVVIERPLWRRFRSQLR
jgi:peptidoglycan/LPS O-acetylase OafA/YrhL